MIARIYVLRDPNSTIVKYVGSTRRKLMDRLSAHCSNPSNNKKGTWIKGLLDNNQRPLIQELETVELEASLERELYWIEHYKLNGGDLLNNNKIHDTSSFERGSGRKSIPEDEKKIPVTFYVYEKNRAAIKAKVEPIIKKLDK